MYETVSDVEVLWAIEVLETPTASALTESLPVSKSTVRRRLRRLTEAGHVETWVTSLPQFPNAYELTDSGHAELEPALADTDEIIYTVGDTRAYSLPPVDGVDGEAGPDSEVAQYFAGRPNALSDDVVLGALARAVYHATPPEARPDGTADDGAAGPATDQADADADGDTDAAGNQGRADTAGAEQPPAATAATATATWHGDAYWVPPRPAHREVDYWRDLVTSDAARRPPPAEPPTPHEGSPPAPVIALPAAPDTLRTDVWIRTTLIARHAPCSATTLRAHLGGLTDTGAAVGRVPDRRRSRPADEQPADAHGGSETEPAAADEPTTTRDADAATPDSEAADADAPVYGHLPGWWRLTPAGCARLAALVDDDVAAVVTQ